MRRCLIILLSAAMLSGCTLDAPIGCSQKGDEWCISACINTVVTHVKSCSDIELICIPGYVDIDEDVSNGCEVNLNIDNDNCGSIGTVCESGHVCINGECLASCLEGQVYCGGKCVDPLTDIAYCGATGTTNSCNDVGTKCATGMVCTNGTCSASCLEGQVYCGGKCVDPKTDITFCGATGTTNSCDDVGTKCATGTVCTNGTCSASCLKGQVYCGGKCVDPRTDTTFCGATGTTTTCTSTGESCAAGNQCYEGTCSLSCQIGLMNCGGKCLDMEATNVQSCSQSSTKLVCEGGFANCDGKVANGCETNVRSDNNNCGECGFVCASGNVCSNGRCTTSCVSSQTNCGGTCINTTDTHVKSCSGTTLTCVYGYAACDSRVANGCETNIYSDNNNCGGCGVLCASGNVCSNGKCVISCPSGQTPCGGYCLTTSWLSSVYNMNADCSCMDGYENANGNSLDGCEMAVN